MKKISVKLKVTLWYTLIMTVMSIVALMVMTTISHDVIKRDVAARITQTVDETSHMIHSPRGMPRKFPDFMFYRRGVHMVLYDEELNIIGGRVPFGIDEEFEFTDDELRTEIYDGNEYYEYDKRIDTQVNGIVWLKGIISVTDESYALRSAEKINIILVFVLILAAAVGGYLIISRAFVPVNKISATAREISKSSDLSRRIKIGSGGDEITALANTFDEMLDKIESTFEREKQFTSDASHELRTPVAVILSECEYMLDCAKSAEEFRESAESIKRQTEKMSKLISELLTISRMDNNTQRISFEETDISELLSFVCDEQEEIHDGSITLVRNISADIYAEVDRFLITRLFMNLISNAYQYGRSGGIINVMLSQMNDSILFVVEDDGIGIAEENIPKIWERFFQADESRTANENGSVGLGLSMVKWIAECHGGTITVDSVLGNGSKFSFIFPAKRVM